ncbi:MAG TPA: PsbP-related protein [Acidimicrobiales bacterium]|jgi:hypothetical protein
MTSRLRTSSHFVALGLGAAALLTATAMIGSTAAAGGATPAKVTDTHDGFTFALPSGWSQVSLKGNKVGQLLGKAKKVSPQLRQTLNSEVTPQTEKSVKVYATATTQSAGVFSNVNVIVESARADLATMEQVDRQGLGQIGAKSITQKAVRYSIGTVSVSSYTLQVEGGTVYGTQVYAGHGNSTYIVSFTAGTPALSATFENQIMRSWRFTATR